MTLLEQLGPAVADQDDWAPQQPSHCAAAQHDAESVLPPSPRRRRWPWIAATALGVGVGVGWLLTTTLAPFSPTSGGRSPIVPPTVASTAELFTSLYLNGNSGDEIRRFYDGEPPSPTGTWVNTAAAVAGEQTGKGMWEVIVAVDSLESSEHGYVPVALGFYVVPISTADGRTVAVAAPARVPGPPHHSHGATVTHEPSTDQGEVAATFIRRYLEGDDTARPMMTNPATIDWFASRPYQSVTVHAVGTDRLGRVIVSARVITANEVAHRLEYLVTMELGANGWLVTDVGAATS